MKVSLADEALEELLEAGKHYTAEAGLALGEAFVAEFERSARLLSRYPGFGTPSNGRARRMPLRRFPLTIVYEARAEEIRIIALAHQKRRPNYWRGRS